MSDEWNVRAMELADLEQVLALEAASHVRPWSAELFRRELDNPVSRIDLLLDGSVVAGYLCSWLVAGELQILNVTTAPAHRRRGVARTLLSHLFARGRTEELEKAFLEVRVGNAAAVALYRSFGFRVIDCRRRYYGDGEDALIMEWTARSRL